MNLKKILSALVAGTMAFSVMNFSVMAEDVEPETIVKTESDSVVAVSDGVAATITNEETSKNESYDDIDDAFAALKKGDTITISAGTHYLNKSTEWHPRNAEFWLPDNVTILGEEGAIIEREPYFYAKGLTVKNVDFLGYSYVAMVIRGNATFEDCKMEGPNGLYYSTITDSLKFINCDIKGEVYGLHVAEGTGTVIVEGGSVSGWNTFGAQVSLECNGTKFVEGEYYNYLGFFHKAKFENCTFDPIIEIGAQDPTKAEIVIVNCVVTDGTDVLDLVVDGSLENVTVAVAEVDGKYYAKLDEALKAVKAGSVVNILEDITITDAWDNRYTGGKVTVPVTINGNGNTIKFACDIADGGNYHTPFRFESDAIINDLTIDMSEASNSRIARVRAISTKAGDIVIDNCTFIGSDTIANSRAVIFGEGAGTSTGNVDVIITNSEFINWTRGISDNENAQNLNSIVISDNEFENASINVSASESITLTGNEMTDSWVTLTDYGKEPTVAIVAKNNDLEDNAGGYNYIKAAASVSAQAGFSVGGSVAVQAKVGDASYSTLQDALDAAVAGDVVVMQGDVTENVVFGDANGIALMSVDSVTLDLNGYTLTSADNSASTIVNYKDLTITNGTVEHTNGKYAVSSMEGSKLTVEDATIKGAGAITLTGATAELKNGTYKKSNNAHTGAHVIRTQDANVVIYDGEFTNEIASDDNGKYYGSVLYLKGASNVTVKDGTFTTANESVLIDGQDSSIINIEGGEFTTEMDIRFYGNSKATISGGKFDVNKCYLSSTANVVVTGGLFTNTTDLKSKVGAESTVIDLENGWFKVVDTAKITTGVSVYFRPVASDVASEKVYDIVLKAADGQEIYEWETADLTFDLDSDTIVYSIAADDNVTLTKKGDDRYMFSMDGVNEFERTDDLIKIGQVKFAGYGEFSFKVATVDENVVMATEVADSIAKEFTVAGGTLTINGTDIDADGDKEDTDDLLGKIDGEEITVPTKDLTINVTFNNKINDNEIAYQDMKVVISGGDLSADIVKNLGNDEIALDDATKTYTVEIKEALTENIVYNVTVTGAGYRTARYEVKMDADKTLNFWNNVKDVATEIESGKDKMQTNFLAGDIVADNIINVYDLSAVVSYFGTESNITNNFVMYDLNRDGMIDSRDVAYVLVSWNK